MTRLIAQVDLARDRVQCPPDHVGNGHERVLGASGVQRLRTERRQSVDLGGALPGRRGFVLRAREQLRGNATRRQERDQHEPVERLGDGERVIGRDEEKSEAPEGNARQR